MKSLNLIQGQSNRPVTIMHFWGGVPQLANSKWLRILHLVEKCSQMGWENIVVFSEKTQSHELIAPFINAGAEVLFHQRLSGSVTLGEIIKTYQFFRVHPCHLMHCHNRPVVPLLSATLNHVPIRIWSRLAMSSSYEENIAPLGIHKLQINIRLSCFLSDKIFCISQPVQDELKNLFGSIEKKVLVGGAGFDLDLYSSGYQENVRKEFSLLKSDFVIVTVGHAVPVKGWDILIPAYSRFRNFFPQSKLLLVGSTELDHEKETTKRIMQLIERHSLQHNVIVTGKRLDISNILAAANLYIQPSRSEGLCGALIEALAAGLPCIASNVGGMSDVIQDGENGLLFAREDVDGLSERMLTLAQNSELRKNLASNALPSVLRYKLETVNDSIVNVYTKLLTNRGYL